MKRHFWVNTAGWPLIVGGIVVMGGWLFRFPFWEFAAPTGTAMVFQSALCFVLAGIGLAGSLLLPNYTKHIRIATGCGIAAISVLMLTEVTLAIDLGVDLTDLHTWYFDKNPQPGRMAPNTAIGFLIGGSALVLSVVSNRIGGLYHALPAAVATLGLIGLAGYTLPFDLAYEWYDVPQMAVTTSIGMLLLGIGLMLDHEDTPKWRNFRTAPAGLSAVTDNRVYAFLGVAVTILAMVVFVSYGSIKALMNRAAWVEHSAEVRTEFEILIALDNRAYSAWQSYAATGDRDSLAELRTASGEVPKRLMYLDQLTADNPAQQERLQAIRERLEEDMAALLRNAELTENERHESREAFLSRQPMLKHYRRQLDVVAEAFRAEESRLLKLRQADSQKSASTTILVILFGNVLGFAIMFYAAWLMKRQNEVRDELSNALQRSYGFLDSLVEHIPNMVFVKDAETLSFVRFNKAGENLLGYASADLIGKNDYDFFPREEADLFTTKDRAVLAGKGIVDIPEEAIHTRHKGVRILHTMKIPICDEHGRPMHLLGISEDITERKRAEKEIFTLNTDLKKRATELEATNKELESFTYSVSHDLRAPLRAINGYALMLEEDYGAVLNAAGARYIAQIRSHSSQMGALIDDLLRLSRLGRQAVRLLHVHMNDLVQEVLHVELATWKGKMPQIKLGELPRADADPQLLRQVWINLISNALKYSSKAVDPVIEISGHIAGPEVIYNVKDNGAGFDMTYYDKLFNVFQRLHSADEFPGTGIGLAIVHRVVTRHSGRVWAESRPDHGAVFSFSLPLNNLETSQPTA